jgi:hypothetical protein
MGSMGDSEKQSEIVAVIIMSMFSGKKQVSQSSITERTSHARIVSMPDEGQCLDTVQMNRLEQSFKLGKGAAGAMSLSTYLADISFDTYGAKLS